MVANRLLKAASFPSISATATVADSEIIEDLEEFGLHIAHGVFEVVVAVSHFRAQDLVALVEPAF